MMLVLSVVSETGVEIQRVNLKQESATIGRIKGNTLVLEDPKRFISSHHAVIDYRAPDYYVSDISTNGVFINELSSPVGNGNCTILSDGDQIHIGNYLLIVSIDTNEQSIDLASGPITGDSFDVDNDPFAQLERDRVQEMIEENQLLPGQKEILEPFESSELDRFASAYKKQGKEKSAEIIQPPAFKEAFQPFNEESKDQKPSKATDIFEEDWFKNNDESSTSSAKEFSSKGKESIDSPADLKPLVEQANSPVNQLDNISTKEPSSASGQATNIIENFLRGAGLENSKANELLTPESFYVIGKILKTSIQGTMDVLVGRNKIKNEMHLDVTTFSSGANNPVKFSVSAEEALKKLLAPEDQGYLSAEEAIEEAYDDIRAHQYSVIAGMQTALLGVLKRFDPDKLEQRLQENNPISAHIPIHKQAMLWSLFEKMYVEIEREASDNFYRLFGEAFSESYEQQINNLKNSKKENPF